MKIKLLCRNLGLIIFANLLMGCASQATNEGTASAQESKSSETTPVDDEVIKLTGTNTETFLTLKQEYLYKALVAEIAFQRGYYPLAAKYFLEVAEQTQDLRLVEQATRIALYAKEDSITIAAARLWVKLAPNNSTARQVLGEMLLRQDRLEEAVEQIEAMFKTAPAEPQELLEVVASLLEQQKDQERAFKLLAELVNKWQNQPWALLIYARSLIRSKQLGQAQPVLEKLLRLKPQHEVAVPLYAVVLYEQKHTKEALEWLKQSLLKQPNNMKWRLTYAKLLTKDRQFERATTQFEELLKISPDKADILQALGVLSLQMEQPQVAKNYFLKLLKTGERPETAYFSLGKIAEDDKNYDQAISWYQKIQAGTHYIDAQAKIAELLAKKGQLETAIKHLHSIQVNSDHEKFSLIQVEAELLIDYKHYEPAMATYNRALESDPENVDLLYLRALLAEQIGQFDQLERDLRQILSIDPNNVQAMNALGYSLADVTDRQEEALQLIKKALELRPEEYYILDSMGWVLYKMGNYVEAIKYLRKALTQKEDSEVRAHLGEVLWVSGAPEEAKQIWREGLEQFPDDEQLRETVKRFLP